MCAGLTSRQSISCWAYKGGAHMVKVYSITVCPWCEKVKRYLKYRGIAYEEHNIEHDAAAL